VYSKLLTVRVEQEDLIVTQTTQQGMEMASNQTYMVFLNTEITEDLRKEGLARELIRAVQQYRKELNLSVEQRVNLTFDASETMKGVIKQFQELLQNNLLVKEMNFGQQEDMKYVELEDEKVGLHIEF